MIAREVTRLMPEPPINAWTRLRNRLQLANQRLATEMGAAAKDIQTLLDRFRDRLTSAAADELEPAVVGSFERLFGELETQLFSDPVGTLEKREPIGRSLAAIEQHRLELHDLARGLPPEITLSGPELIAIIGPDLGNGWGRQALKWRRSPQPIPMRTMVAAYSCRLLERRRSMDAAFELVLMQAELHLVAAWQVYRRHRLAMLTNGRADRRALTEEQQWWTRTEVALVARIERLTRAYQHWADAAPAMLGRAMARPSPDLSERRQGKLAAQRQTAFSRWHRQQRGVSALIDLERRLSTLARDIAQNTRQALDSLRAGHEEVTRELDQVLDWLDCALEQRDGAIFPPPKANLISAEQRAREWCDRASYRVRLRVPASVEVVRPVHALPAWRQPWRQLDPQGALENALTHGGMDAARAAFREAENEHAAIIRDIEHARQVLTFAVEAGQEEGQATALPREAAANARALLQHRKEILIDPLPAAESGLGHAQALTLLEAHTALETGRLGLFALLTRQGGPRATRELGQVALHATQVGARGAWSAMGGALQWAGWRLGLQRRLAPRFEPVVVQPRLSAILEIQLRARELPALYQRLFRLAPVEDPRFLVGREIEMESLTQAFALWKSGRSATVFVVGARGSGKTSLLNCAAQTAFTGVPIVRGQFDRRVLSADEMSQFLRELFEIPAGEDLGPFLNQGRRVAVIEEFERTFLRRMNGFEALRSFLRLVAATSSSTLWILSMNQASFRYLDAVLGLGRSFSHRVNAMAVSRERIMEAILQRHTLSGLRLQFAPVPARDPRVQRLRRFLGLELTPQQMFFEALYRQSEGLFRSAFELWLGSIERIEGAVVQMMQPLDPTYSPLEAALGPDELFTLQAVLQHASLTPEELAAVFNIGTEAARSRLERLQALEILEPEPACPGLRVRSQAGRFVRDALDQQNLL